MNQSWFIKKWSYLKMASKFQEISAQFFILIIFKLFSLCKTWFKWWTMKWQWLDIDLSSWSGSYSLVTPTTYSRDVTVLLLWLFCSIIGNNLVFSPHPDSSTLPFSCWRLRFLFWWWLCWCFLGGLGFSFVRCQVTVIVTRYLNVQLIVSTCFCVCWTWCPKVHLIVK